MVDLEYRSAVRRCADRTRPRRNGTLAGGTIRSLRCVRSALIRGVPPRSGGFASHQVDRWGPDPSSHRPAAPVDPGPVGSADRRIASLRAN